MELKHRVVREWQTTVLGLGIIALLGYLVHLKPELLDHPELLVPVAVGLWGVFTKRNHSKNSATKSDE
jgi:hypothetical protein